MTSLMSGFHDREQNINFYVLNFFFSFHFSEEQVFRLKKDNEDLRLYSERLTEGLEKTKAQLDFYMRHSVTASKMLIFMLLISFLLFIFQKNK